MTSLSTRLLMCSFLCVERKRKRERDCRFYLFRVDDDHTDNYKATIHLSWMLLSFFVKMTSFALMSPILTMSTYSCLKSQEVLAQSFKMMHDYENELPTLYSYLMVDTIVTKDLFGCRLSYYVLPYHFLLITLNLYNCWSLLYECHFQCKIALNASRKKSKNSL